jgi:hypothetical protein
MMKRENPPAGTLCEFKALITELKLGDVLEDVFSNICL